jgi:hypothetical protein
MFNNIDIPPELLIIVITDNIEYLYDIIYYIISYLSILYNMNVSPDKLHRLFAVKLSLGCICQWSLLNDLRSFMYLNQTCPFLIQIRVF